MKIKRCVAGAAVFFFVHDGFAADANSDEWTRSALYVTAVADIDAQGRIAHIDLLPEMDKSAVRLAAELAPVAKATMSHWEFEPATVEGKPTWAHTFLSGVFEFRPKGRQFEARLAFVSSGPRLDRRRAVLFPDYMINAHVEADVTMLALVQPDGRLSDIHLESAQSTDRRPVAAFVKAAKEAMYFWRAEPETVDGHGVKTWVRVPITFSFDSGGSRGQGARRLERAVDSPEAPSESQLGDQSVALDSPVKFRRLSP